eukprot:9503907-Pyramimonas_sp.AAC.3
MAATAVSTNGRMRSISHTVSTARITSASSGSLAPPKSALASWRCDPIGSRQSSAIAATDPAPSVRAPAANKPFPHSPISHHKSCRVLPRHLAEEDEPPDGVPWPGSPRLVLSTKGCGGGGGMFVFCMMLGMSAPSTTEGRSVCSTCAPMAAAHRPARPMPEPSSSTRLPTSFGASSSCSIFTKRKVPCQTTKPVAAAGLRPIPTANIFANRLTILTIGATDKEVSAEGM